MSQSRSNEFTRWVVQLRPPNQDTSTVGSPRTSVSVRDHFWRCCGRLGSFSVQRQQSRQDRILRNRRRVRGVPLIDSPHRAVEGGVGIRQPGWALERLGGVRLLKFSGPAASGFSHARRRVSRAHALRGNSARGRDCPRRAGSRSRSATFPAIWPRRDDAGDRHRCHAAGGGGRTERPRRAAPRACGRARAPVPLARSGARRRGIPTAYASAAVAH